MKFAIENDNNIIVFSIMDKTIGADLAPELKAKILIEAQPDIKGMIFELANVESLDSSGLGALLLANRQLRDYEIPVYIVKANEFIKNLMSLTKIDQMFNFFESIDDAKNAVENKFSEN